MQLDLGNPVVLRTGITPIDDLCTIGDGRDPYFWTFYWVYFRWQHFNFFMTLRRELAL